MLPLIIEPEKWERPALVELAERLNEAQRGILGAFESGYAVARDPQVLVREPERREAAVALLRIAIDLYEAEKNSSSTDLTLVRLVNLQYQTITTVMVLVPPPLLAEARMRAKAWKDATTPPSPPPASDRTASSP
jgi:hypothetical protein